MSIMSVGSNLSQSFGDGTSSSSVLKGNRQIMVKITDLGNSESFFCNWYLHFMLFLTHLATCTEHHFTDDIQTWQYCCPEVILGVKCGTSTDSWGVVWGWLPPWYSKDNNNITQCISAEGWATTVKHTDTQIELHMQALINSLPAAKSLVLIFGPIWILHLVCSTSYIVVEDYNSVKLINSEWVRHTLDRLAEGLRHGKRQS